MLHTTQILKLGSRDGTDKIMSLHQRIQLDRRLCRARQLELGTLTRGAETTQCAIGGAEGEMMTRFEFGAEMSHQT